MRKAGEALTQQHRSFSAVFLEICPASANRASILAPTGYPPTRERRKTEAAQEGAPNSCPRKKKGFASSSPARVRERKSEKARNRKREGITD